MSRHSRSFHGTLGAKRRAMADGSPRSRERGLLRKRPLEEAPLSRLALLGHPLPQGERTPSVRLALRSSLAQIPHSLPRSRGAFRVRALAGSVRLGEKIQGRAGRREPQPTRGPRPLAKPGQSGASRKTPLAVEPCRKSAASRSVPRAVFVGLLRRTPGGLTFQAPPPFHWSGIRAYPPLAGPRGAWRSVPLYGARPIGP